MKLIVLRKRKVDGFKACTCNSVGCGVNCGSQVGCNVNTK